MCALFRGLYLKAGTAKMQSTVTSMVDNFLPIVESHFITYHQNTSSSAVHMHLCTCPHTYIQTHSTTDNHTIKAALDIPMETCIATSMYPPLSTKCTMTTCHVGNTKLHRYSGLSKTETSSRQGNHASVGI